MTLAWYLPAHPKLGPPIIIEMNMFIVDAMRLVLRLSLVPTVVAVAVAGCGDGRDSKAKVVEMPSFTDPDLRQGRGVWMQTCRACHLTGVGGAPAVTDFAQWDVRLPQGRDTLADHVINGIVGEDGAYRMPPRGGNDRLTDAQIKLAVDYKIAAISKLRAQSE